MTNQSSDNNSTARQLITDQFHDIAPFRFPVLIRTIAILMIGVLIIASFAHIEILCAFLRRPSILTPFTVHILDITIINLISVAFYDPLIIVRDLNRELFRGNIVLCGIYKYLHWTAVSISMQQHFVICLDRWLAVLTPNWYRTKASHSIHAEPFLLCSKTLIKC